MTRVFLDAVLRSKLHNLDQPLEFCDEAGQLLGRFYPILDPLHYEPLEPQISQEELERRKRSDEKRYTTAEVLAHLEKL